MEVTTSTQEGYWETIPAQIQCHSDREVWTIVYEGKWDVLKNAFSQYIVGTSIPRADFDTLGSIYQPAMIVSGVTFSRKQAGMGEVRLQYTLLYMREIWNLDFSEISKNIKNWLVLQYTTWVNGVPSVDMECYSELQKIKQWEHQKDIGAFTAWGEFKYDGSKILTGDTLLLAKKMMKGIDNYPVYTPVITRTTTWAFNPPVGEIGCKVTPESRPGWQGFSSEAPDWTQLANVFLKTAERSHANGDGTFTLTEQWTGADELDSDLYPTAS